MTADLITRARAAETRDEECDAALMVDMSTIVAGPDRGKVCRKLLSILIDALTECERNTTWADCCRVIRERGLQFWDADGQTGGEG